MFCKLPGVVGRPGVTCCCPKVLLQHPGESVWCNRKAASTIKVSEQLARVVVVLVLEKREVRSGFGLYQSCVSSENKVREHLPYLQRASHRFLSDKCCRLGRASPIVPVNPSPARLRRPSCHLVAESETVRGGSRH